MDLADSRGKLKHRDQLYRGKIVDLVVDQIEIGGQRYVREVVRHPGGVVVIGRTKEGKIPFVRQHRYPMNADLLELPAGKIDPGEDPIVGAGRELEEETGYRAGRLELVYRFYSSPGFCDEMLHLYHALDLEKTAPRREVDEIVIVEEHSLPQALQLLAKGDLLDAKKIVAVLWLAQFDSAYPGKIST